ncbi:MAG: hypothetical protein FD157_2900 [Rhodocyclaceae bacterium]|nr:MAG: hypothetical protein FD157_2900 [Rhodocyclaceae bacterium]TND03849.1 MAG: hypothetical protein FD118_1267 [Rhodocyclaceae bacterium]
MARDSYRILGQGHLDGACFLYAIANAMLCLTNRTNERVPQKRWSKMISFLNAGDFLDGCIGTAKTDDNPDLQELLAYECICRLDPKSKYVVETKNHLTWRSNFDQLATQDTVLLLPTREHWYCLVDTQDKLAYLACSAAWQESRSKYREDTSPRLSRVCNKTIAFKELTIYQKRAILISRISKRANG